MAKWLDAVLLVAGMALIVWGTWRVCPDAAPFAGGIMLIVLSVLVGLAAPRKGGEQ